MQTINVKVFHLEMLNYAKRTVTPPRDGLTVIHAKKPTVAYYRFLYKAVGEDYNWQTRGKMPDDELATSLHHPRHEVHVLHVDGTPAGFAELDCRNSEDIELLQFGLMPEFIGRGLGKWFLQWTIDKVWSQQPKRFWLHTCTLDHPVALPNYLKSGFSMFKEEMIKREIPG